MDILLFKGIEKCLHFENFKKRQIQIAPKIVAAIGL